MPRHSNAECVAPSVKLFPRLAASKATARSVRVDRPAAIGRETIVATFDNRAAEATQVRFRLLQMILDNERARRSERRPLPR